MVKYPIPFFGQALTEKTFEMNFTPYVLLHTSPIGDICMQIADKGLDTWGIYEGDYLFFRKEVDIQIESLVLVNLDGFYIVRQLMVSYAEPFLRVPEDIYPSIPFAAGRGAIEAVLSGVLKNSEEIQLQSIDELWEGAS